MDKDMFKVCQSFSVLALTCGGDFKIVGEDQNLVKLVIL